MRSDQDEPSTGDQGALSARMSRADQWAAGADERERLADERERLADEREALADEREQLADRHDHVLDRREAVNAAAAQNDDDARAAELAAAAVLRAEEAVERAAAQLLRARQAAARAQARTARTTASAARVDATQLAEQATDTSDQTWLADRRDFVAAERERLADLRDELAEQRDTTADQRELLADHREHKALSRDRLLGNRPHDASVIRPPHADDALVSALRDRMRLGREGAAASRRTAAARRAADLADWGPQTYGPMLLTSFAQLAQQLFGADDLTQALPAVLKHTVGVVTGCDWAAITLIARDGQPTTVASGPIAAELDELQFATGIGPSIIALGSDGPVIVPDLHHASRWPVLAATATQLGAASALCHGLFTHHPGQWTKLGTLTLYGESTQAFSDDDQEFAAILAAFIAVIATLVQRRDDVDRREAALHRALSTRDVIGQAKGILMERQHLSAGDAFDLLRRASQRLNRRLADIAGHLAETGELPT